MKQVLVRKGEVFVEEVPAPLVDENSVLVEVRYSLISTGTEIAGVVSSGESVLQKALRQPENVKKVLDAAKSHGVVRTIGRVRDKLESPDPTGYSCAGVVMEVGRNVKDIQIGDRIACAGAGKANHAEVVCVPRNLVVEVPDNLDLKEAASVTLGAIAMQGVRWASPTFGEAVAVIGLGLIGQLTAQILKVAGCRVIGIDLLKSRVELAQSLGMDYGIVAGEHNIVATVLRYTSGYGADGIDYPYAYVRWTENRNMEEYLRILADGRINFKALVSREYAIEDSPEAYKELKESEDKPLGVLLKYSAKWEVRS